MRRIPAAVLLPVLLLLLLAPNPAGAARKESAEEKEEEQGPLSPGTFTGLKLRSLGPAVRSGRIIDLAVHPGDRARYFVAVASGGVWKTVNAGTTWTPVFDDQGSYSIGCVTLDPSDPLTVWVGTGENNSQRSVGYGDGVYKSVDGGASWERMGLEISEHIGRIVIDPRDSKTVYVAAQGPLWAPGGDRGLYKTTDGGKSWTRILEISENTGVTDVVLDPRNPDILYAAAYQRRRHVWTLINGGPESALYKSTDAGATWRKLEKGLPEGVDLGRIGLAIAPADPDVVYALVEAAGGEGGFFRSTDAGSTWEKRSGYMTRSPQYYQEIISDPRDVDRVYSMDVRMMVTEDGGKTFRQVGEKHKHVDNHALWIDPANTRYLLAGCDGGVYESFDRGGTWRFKANLPVTQFYRVSADNDRPFYNVYGGTQDNATLGGPSRTISVSGITNGDWFVTVFGDGYKTRVDPENPDIIYSQWQYGGLVRHDRRSGETIDIQPQPGRGEEALRWNWDSPLVLSPHLHTRLYFAANRIFRTDDRGDSWRAISPDLTRRLDRSTLEVMGKVWSVDAVARHESTSFFGNIVSLDESPLVENLIYAGTDDGLIQVTEDGGENWRRVERFPGVPEMTYVSRIETSRHHPGRVYAAFDNHKNGDFRPYLLRSDDRGHTWTSVAGDLPERGSVYALVEDHARPELLFAGTEFGVFFTIDGGARWIQLKGGMPVIAVRDLEIQRRENDLVVGTFGRGIYILDDYTPLRLVTPELLEREVVLFPVKDPPMFLPSVPLGRAAKANQGDAFYTAPNPPFGAVLTYYLKDELKTRKKVRRELEKEIEKEGGTPEQPTWDAMRAEAREKEPVVLLTVTDTEGNVVRRLTGPVGKGIHRVAWDLGYAPTRPASLTPPPTDRPFRSLPRGPMVVPGEYIVSLAHRVDGRTTSLGEPQRFTARPLGLATLPAEDQEARLAFQRKTARLQAAVLGAVRVAGEAQHRISHLARALRDTPDADPGLQDEVQALETRLKDLQLVLSGDPVRRAYFEPIPPSIVARVGRVVGAHWKSTSAPTQTHLESYRIAAEAFGILLEELRTLIEVELKRVEDAMEEAGAPWTPGRVPRWTLE